MKTPEEEAAEKKAAAEERKAKAAAKRAEAKAKVDAKKADDKAKSDKAAADAKAKTGGKPKPKAGPEMISVKTVRGVKSRRRIGRAFGPKPVRIPIEDLIEGEAETLDSDPALVVEVVAD